MCSFQNKKRERSNSKYDEKLRSGHSEKVFREWQHNVYLLPGSIFADPKTGLFPVLDNLFAEQQSRGMLVKSHNSLSLDDVRKIMSSPMTSTKSSIGFMRRLVFSLGITLGARTTALTEITVDQFKKGQSNREDVYIFTEKFEISSGPLMFRRADFEL